MSEIFNPPGPLNTAVLFLIFNRPNTTSQVFEAIRKAKPPRLYVAADGPRDGREDEVDRVEKARQIATAVDWSCDVKTLFREKNLGCGPAVKTAIDWFFEAESQGIVLEDDTVPVQSFFWYCEELLEKYKNDDRIGMINGTNRIGSDFFSASYLYSKNKDCWGWASWSRAWKKMDFTMSWRDGSQHEDIVENMGIGRLYIKHWNDALDELVDNKVDTWDWQWYFTISSQNQLTIFPRVNLITNVGFGEDATHTKRINNRWLPASEINFPLRSPEHITPASKWDKLFIVSRKSRFALIKDMVPLSVRRMIKFLLKKINW